MKTSLVCLLLRQTNIYEEQGTFVKKQYLIICNFIAVLVLNTDLQMKDSNRAFFYKR